MRNCSRKIVKLRKLKKKLKADENCLAAPYQFFVYLNFVGRVEKLI